MLEFKPFTVEKPWGNFRQFTHNISSTVKIITVNKDQKLSLQNHTKRSEFWRVIDGGGVVQIGEVQHTARKGDEYEVSLGAKHRLTAGPSGIIVLEIATGDFDEEDITRYEDEYGRA